MHPPILVSRALAAATLLASTIAVAAATKPAPGVDANCPVHATAVVEHFMGADCMDCWKAAPPAPGASGAADTDWSMDWIAPATDDASMAPAALPEAADRLSRLGAGLPTLLATPPKAFDARAVLDATPANRRFYVHSSLPHSGYMGVQMHATGVWPAGSSAWIALVELIPVGTRDSAIPRRLVRVLVGPVKLPAGPGAKNAVAPLYGLRWPENAHADQLVATAWVESADGRITQIATDRCTDPR